MRPNTLSIQAFGPFAGTEVINFDRLGSNPLFLINGPTGSGKSSILDAICFALYGQTTGKERDATQMRCDHADDNLLTEVTLEFTLGDLRYRIRRSPTQDKPKSRGEGYTIHQTEACLWLVANGGDRVLVPKKAQEATRLVEEKTGLNVEQFRQVMVLPQGKFRDFLMADSGQRETIFSKLFQTQIYKRLEDALKERAAGIRKDVEDLRNQIMGILHSVDLSNEDEISSELKQLEPQWDTANNIKEATAIKLANANKQLEAGLRLNNAFSALKDSETLVQSLLSRQDEFIEKTTGLNRSVAAHKISHLQAQVLKLEQSEELILSEIEQSEANKIEHQTALDLSLEKLKEAEKNQSAIDGFKQQLTELQKLLPKIDELSAATDNVDKHQTISRTAEQAFLNCRKNIDDTKNAIHALELKRIDLTTLVQSLPEIVDQRATLEIQGKNRKKLDSLLETQERLYDQQALNLASLGQWENEVGQQDTRVKTLEFRWHNNQAAILAAELKFGTPCPVCGSIEHPKLATNTDQQVTKSDIDLAKEALETAQSQLSHARNLLTQSETQIESNELAIKEAQHELGEAQFQTTDTLREQYRLANDKVKSLEQQKLLLEQCNTDLKSLTVKFDATSQQLEATRQEQQQANQNYELSKQHLESVEQQLPEYYRIPDRIAEDMAKLDQQITALAHAYQQANLSKNQAQEFLTNTLSALDQQRKQRGVIQKDLQDANAIWLSSLSSSDFQDVAEFQSALLSEEKQIVLQQEIQQFNDQLTGSKATLAQQRDQLKDDSPQDLEKLQARRDTIEEQSHEALTAWQQINHRVQQLTGVQVKLVNTHKKNKALEEEYKVYGTLSDVANGQTGNKISLQRFVLSVLLDDVLVEASHRLNAMSKGRYQLLRKEDRAKGNKASGLELEVEDAYTGKSRSVATLSGGESFMAALSLALGLSDVVQAYAGGIKLDTLFIDEGFGSLDQESLDLAIKTLIDLQATGRMIGIISHVSELREQMQLRVDVVASASGSRIG